MARVSLFMSVISCLIGAQVGRAEDPTLLTTHQFRSEHPELYARTTEAISAATSVWDTAIDHYQERGIRMVASAVNARLLKKELTPPVLVVVASIGSTGEHSVEYSFVFSDSDSSLELIASDVPYFITDIAWIESGTELTFSGEYVIDFCANCDGPSVAEPLSLVSIPVRGTISGGRASARFAGGPYCHYVARDRIARLFSAEANPWPDLRARVQHARRLLTAYGALP